ncbi:hypothetical protein DPMN_184654 [Dreissena polymorpha]|uniref:Uncharacterized protein n=1 Tax=Dreissena polymorpha TaxID=45954 RepID=A0A9D4DIB7_DREPO|nr:hypothetical protein DPMN_184654 [Dreissena polymorpha]
MSTKGRVVDFAIDFNSRGILSDDPGLIGVAWGGVSPPELKQLTKENNSIDDEVREIIHQIYVKKKYEYNVKIESDKSQTCYISGICILPSGETIVADYYNKRVKMLDNHYNVSSDLKVDGNPQGICQIFPSQVAITFENSVQFINVSNGKLVRGELLEIDKGDYETSELPHATLVITYIRVIFYKCVLHPDGNWIYVTNFAQNKLMALTIHGTLMSTFTDPELQGQKVYTSHPQDKSLSVVSDHILSYKWIVGGERNWQLWLQRKMDCATQCLSATTRAVTRSLWDYLIAIQSVL